MRLLRTSLRFVLAWTLTWHAILIRRLKGALQKHKFYVQGESCHHCYNVSNKKQKQKFKERQKQIKLSKLKNESHIGIPNIKSKITKL